MFCRIDHLALHVRDLQKSIGFYETNFGFRRYFQHTVAPGHEIAYLKLGDTVLELTQKSDDFMDGFHFCVRTEKFNAAVSMLQERGIEIVREAHPTPPREPGEEGWRRAVFRGPDGEQIELRG